MSTQATDPVAEAARAELASVDTQMERVRSQLDAQMAALRERQAQELAPLRARKAQLARVLATLDGARSANAANRRQRRRRGGVVEQAGEQTREVVLAAVRQAGSEGTTGAAIAKATGRSANSVRAHLRALVESGHVVREGQRNDTRFIVKADGEGERQAASAQTAQAGQRS